MKKVTEKDLSLDKQEVSNLTGGSGAGNETDNELICASKVCTDSQYDICCNDTEKTLKKAQKMVGKKYKIDGVNIQVKEKY